MSSAYIDLQAPFLRLENLQEQCDPDYPLALFHQSLRKEKSWSIPELYSSATEFYQHHQHHDGQEFGLLHILLTDDDSTPTIEMLLVESCGDGTWRRLELTSVLWCSLEQLMESQLRDEDDEEFVEYIRRNSEEIVAMTKPVQEAPWEVKTLRLV